MDGVVGRGRGQQAALGMHRRGSQDRPKQRERLALPREGDGEEGPHGLRGLRQSAPCQTKKTLFNVQINY